MYQCKRPEGLYESIRMVDGRCVAFRGKSPQEIYKKILDYKGKIDRGMTFLEVSDRWKREHLPTLAPNTLKGYTPAILWANEHFGSKYVKEITSAEIKSFIDGFAKKGFAQKTVKTQLLMLNLIFKYAVLMGDNQQPMRVYQHSQESAARASRNPSDDDQAR